MMNENYNAGYPALFKDFANYKITVQGRSPLTVKEYLLDLRTFSRYLVASRSGMKTDQESIKDIDISKLDTEFYKSVTEEEIYSFIVYSSLDRENKSPTRSRKLSSIKSFYKFLTSTRHLLDKNPAVNIDSPKQKKSLPKYLSLEESKKLLEAVKNDPESKTRERDYAILTLFLNCGMRLSELAGIKLSDMDPELRSIRILGKGAKERIIYLNDSCKMAITHYLPVRMTMRRPGMYEDMLFLSRLGKGISIKTIQWIVKKYLNEAGLEYKHYSTHKLRHTAATLMYQTGKVDIRVLKDILGHEQLTTTQIYTHVSDENMQRAMMMNPLAEENADMPKQNRSLKDIDEKKDRDK